MKRIYFLILSVINIINILAQMPIEEINHRLETRPYFNLGLDYKSIITLPDTVQVKVINALKRMLPQQYADSVFVLPDAVLKNIEKYAWGQCKNDTACFEKVYAERYAMNIQDSKDYYYNQCYSTSLILACGNWNVKDAIPYLKKELQNTKCENWHLELEMALVKLGNDSIQQIFNEKYTLSYILKNTSIDIINDKALLTYDVWENVWSVNEGLQVAMYLKDKEILLNILDLIYIRGLSRFCVDTDCFDYPYVSYFVDEFYNYNYFHKYPNYVILRKITDDYRSAIWNLYDKKRNKREQQELDKLLSAEYRTKIKEQLRGWIIENVNFE